MAWLVAADNFHQWRAGSWPPGDAGFRYGSKCSATRSQIWSALWEPSTSITLGAMYASRSDRVLGHREYAALGWDASRAPTAPLRDRYATLDPPPSARRVQQRSGTEADRTRPPLRSNHPKSTGCSHRLMQVRLDGYASAGSSAASRTPTATPSPTTRPASPSCTPRSPDAAAFHRRRPTPSTTGPTSRT